MVRAVAFFATACILPGAPVARPEPRESRPGREIQWLCPPDDQGAETPPCPLERAQQQLCQLKQLRQVLEESRDQLAQGKKVLDSLYDGAEDLINDENEMTILEWLLKGGTALPSFESFRVTGSPFRAKGVAKNGVPFSSGTNY